MAQLDLWPPLHRGWNHIWYPPSRSPRCVVHAPPDCAEAPGQVRGYTKEKWARVEPNVPVLFVPGVARILDCHTGRWDCARVAAVDAEPDGRAAAACGEATKGFYFLLDVSV